MASVVVLTLASSEGFAKEKKVRNPAAAPAPTHSSPALSGVGTTTMNFSGPITIAGGTVAWGPWINIMHEVYPNLLIGGDTGIQLAGVANTTAIHIPILLTGIYNIHSAQMPTFRPFVGLGLGIGIITASSWGTTGFEGLLHLGARFGAKQEWTFDARLGVWSGSFLFAPTIGYTIPII